VQTIFIGWLLWRLIGDRLGYDVEKVLTLMFEYCVFNGCFLFLILTMFLVERVGYFGGYFVGFGCGE